MRGLSRRLDAARRRRDAQQTRLDQLNQQRSELETQLRQVRAKASGLEQEAAGVEQKIARFREQMNEVKSNKEYSALLVEVNTLKIEKSKLEDEALERMGETEQIQQRLTELQEKVTEQEKLLSLASAELDQAQAAVGDRLEQLEQERQAASKGLPAEALAVFRRQADHHEGEALAEVQEEDRRRREYICGGCYMQLPVECVNALIMRPDELVTCPSCGRILYMQQELKAALAVK